MNRLYLIKIAVRLSVLLIMVVGLVTLLLSGESKVRASVNVTDTCDTAYGYCIYQCASLEGTDYQACQSSCSLSFEDCQLNGGGEGDPPPAPYPVIDHSLSSCLTGCLACNQIENPSDRVACGVTCRSYCFETYPKPR